MPHPPTCPTTAAAAAVCTAVDVDAGDPAVLDTGGMELPPPVGTLTNEPTDEEDAAELVGWLPLPLPMLLPPPVLCGCECVGVAALEVAEALVGLATTVVVVVELAGGFEAEDDEAGAEAEEEEEPVLTSEQNFWVAGRTWSLWRCTSCQ
jgi:hypothetical protein